MSINPRSKRSSSSSSPPSNAKRSLEDSPDIFANSSPECDNSKTIATASLSITDDSETDELLSTVTGEALGEKSSPKKLINKEEKKFKQTNTTSSNGSSSTNAAKPRQRTLLEMLDRSYNQTGPASKKYCASKSTQEKY